MKKILIGLVFFMISNAYSQRFHCETKGFIMHSANFNRPSPTGQTDVDLTTPYVVNAYFTLVKGAGNHINGVNPDELATNEQIENKFLDCIKILNIRFNPFNIYFKYIGFQAVTNPLFDEPDNATWEALSQYKYPNAMNFYFINSFNAGLEGTDGTASGSVLGGTESAYQNVVLGSSPAIHNVLDYSLVHHVAHNFALYHAYETGSHYDPELFPEINYIAQCERVTRDPDDPIYNAHLAGDEVADTPAQPIIYDNAFPLTCEPFAPSGTNCYGENYLNNVVKNYMNINNQLYDTTCPWAFTLGQVQRMRDYLNTNVTNYGYLEPNSVRADVDALYEPFFVQVQPGDIVSTEDQPDNGGMIVCRSQKYKLRFQPGFEQVFSNIPNSPVTQSANQQFNYLNDFDHAIGVTIPSLGSTTKSVGVISSITGLSCSFEAYTSGTVYSMAVLGSMNMTVKELNEIEVKDPELYDKLMAQYYYILKKMTVSGAQIQQTFYKY